MSTFNRQLRNALAAQNAGMRMVEAALMEATVPIAVQLSEALSLLKSVRAFLLAKVK